MLNAKNERELAYLVLIDAIEPIVGSDNCEAAVVGGWRVMVKKETFKPGDVAIYFEIDSKVPETEPFKFLEKKHYKVKTQKYTFGGRGLMISQGLLMHPDDFGWQSKLPEFECEVVIDNNGNVHKINDETRFLTQELNVTYAVDADNKRKGAGVNKYQSMAARNPKIFKQRWARWMMKSEWGRKVMFFFFGSKKDARKSWPTEISKTDEERIQNQPWRFTDEHFRGPYIATEKLDGTSTTFLYRRKKKEFLVCSRNVVFNAPDKKCFYDTNVYQEMAAKYNIEEKLALFAKAWNLDWVALQGETYGAGIQKREYGLEGHDFAVFNVIGPAGRCGSLEAKAICDDYGIPFVPIIDTEFYLPETMDELLAYAGSAPSVIDGGMREGIVFRSHDGKDSFKAVDNEFLLRFH